MIDFRELDNYTLGRLGLPPQENALDALLLKNRAQDEGSATLRDYQTDLVMRVEDALQTNRSVCLQSATGSGKSVMLAEIAKHWPGRTWWLTHRKELETQSAGHLQRAGRHDAIVTSPIRYWNRVRKGEYKPGVHDLQIVDEAHHAPAATWARAIDQFPGQVLGATATPWRLSKTQGLDGVFDVLVCGPQVSELIAYGYLSDCRVMTPATDDRIQGSGYTGGDFSELATWNANPHSIMVEQAIEWLCLHDPGRAIIYACGQEHAHSLMDALDATDRKAALLTAKTEPQERTRIEQEFRSGAINTMVNIAIATEGFDVPECDAVVLARPTKSLALYLQMVGRALRPKDKPALIFDACAMSLEHGLPAFDRKWTLAPRGEGTPGEPWPQPVCDSCGTVNHPMAKYCQGCGIKRWEACERCSKPVFDGECTRCTRVQQIQDIRGHVDENGLPIWDEGRDRPMCGYVKLREGYSSYGGSYGAVWKTPSPSTDAILPAGTVVTMVTRAGRKSRAKIVEHEGNAPFGQIYVTNKSVRA